MKALKPVFALQQYTVKKEGERWYYAKTYCQGDKPEWRGPFSSEHSVTLVIARELRRELTRRCARLAA